MLIISGTVPFDEIDIVFGKLSLRREKISVGAHTLPISRGTTAIAASACIENEAYGIFSGDIGTGEGSIRLYRFLKEEIPKLSPDILCLGYVFPWKELHRMFFSEIEKMKKKPIFIADAGFMYAAKIDGKASKYDIFCPDLGELAFLADEKAPHPFYTRGFLFQIEEPEELIKRAYRIGCASKVMCVKGKTDYICKEGRIIYKVEEPFVPELEPIGGTGDTVTGMIANFVSKGFSPEKAAFFAAKANRLAADLLKPDPSVQISELIHFLPKALDVVG